MVRFRLLTEADVKTVLTMEDLIETMASALQRFSTGRVVQPVRSVIAVDGDQAFFATMPAFVEGMRRPDSSAAGSVVLGGNDAADSGAGLGAKLVTVFG